MTDANDPQASSKSPVNSKASTFLTRLTISGFRSYDRLVLELDGRPAVLTGPNGSGKTNILEAISCLGPGRGLRGAPKADLARVRDGKRTSSWGIHAAFETPSGPVEIATGMTEDAAGARQITRLNGQAATATDISDILRLVWLTPAMDRLFIEAAGNRRRFFDRLVLAFDPAHGSRVNAYERAMRERTRLLREPVYDTGWVAALEARMAGNGIAIAASRRAMLAALTASIGGGRADFGAFPSARLAVHCDVQDWLDGLSALDAEDRLCEVLAGNRALDAGAGRALKGVHRADLAVWHDAKQITAAQCSTGEQKALLITILLAHARLQRSDGRGRAPILLLDEITAHLDAARRHHLFEALDRLGVQVWMTGTEVALFEDWGARAQYFSLPEIGGG